MPTYAVKPGDRFVARVIGTAPELPDWSLDDDPVYDPDFWAIRQWDDLPEGVDSLITYHGPKGTVVVAHGIEGFTYYADEYGGRVLLRMVWDADKRTWYRVVGG